MKDIEATVSSKIVEDQHYTIELYFGRPLYGWQIGLVNSLFLPTRAETWACVLVVLLEGHFKMSLGRPHSRTHGCVAKSVLTTG
ncbi:Protein FMP27, mitochondrial [Gossypium arboreum]|uniref:Protein FMP27, mitochondrial n=1 Tax=Gossypium arboreum TaxID=29729 RepID=A0A0B0N271_GOSAR|nr:Protein FMP27, mitochondrial [Gossypium arboreum]